MKNLYNEINERWIKCRKWSETSLIGDIVVNTGRIIFIIAVIFGAYCIIESSIAKNASQDTSSNATTTQNCNVTGINLHGFLTTYIPPHADNDTSFNYDSVSSENIISTITTSNSDPKIKSIIVEVDSTGGIAEAGSEVAETIKNSKKPVVAFIRSQGDSSAYWAISGADRIFASRNSDVGSIGITRSFLDNSKKDQKDGYTFNQLNSGKYKDSGSLDKVLTDDEKSLFMRDITIMFNNFVEDVATNRKLPIDKVKAIADGSTVLGVEAKQDGLIDEIGGFNEAKDYVGSLIKEEPSVCW